MQARTLKAGYRADVLVLKARAAYLASLDIPTLWRGAAQTIPDAGHRRLTAFVDETAEKARPRFSDRTPVKSMS